MSSSARIAGVVCLLAAVGLPIALWYRSEMGDPLSVVVVAERYVCAPGDTLDLKVNVSPPSDAVHLSWYGLEGSRTLPTEQWKAPSRPGVFTIKVLAQLGSRRAEDAVSLMVVPSIDKTAIRLGPKTVVPLPLCKQNPREASPSRAFRMDLLTPVCSGGNAIVALRDQRKGNGTTHESPRVRNVRVGLCPAQGHSLVRELPGFVQARVNQPFNLRLPVVSESTSTSLCVVEDVATANASSEALTTSPSASLQARDSGARTHHGGCMRWHRFWLTFSRCGGGLLDDKLIADFYADLVSPGIFRFRAKRPHRALQPSQRKVAFHWDFGDGTRQRSASPIVTHRYKVAAPYYFVKLRVSDGSEQTRTSRVISDRSYSAPTDLGR